MSSTSKMSDSSIMIEFGCGATIEVAALPVVHSIVSIDATYENRSEMCRHHDVDEKREIPAMQELVSSVFADFILEATWYEQQEALTLADLTDAMNKYCKDARFDKGRTSFVECYFGGARWKFRKCFDVKSQHQPDGGECEVGEILLEIESTEVGEMDTYTTRSHVIVTIPCVVSYKHRVYGMSREFVKWLSVEGKPIRKRVREALALERVE